MGNEQVQRIGPFAIVGMDGAASRQGARQTMLFDPGGGKPRQQSVAVLSNATQIAVELLKMVRKAGPGGQILDLIDVVRAEAATVDLLEADDVKMAQHVADHIQPPRALRVG